MVDEQNEQQPPEGLLLAIVQNAGQARERPGPGQGAITEEPDEHRLGGVWIRAMNFTPWQVPLTLKPREVRPDRIGGRIRRSARGRRGR